MAVVFSSVGMELMMGLNNNSRSPPELEKMMVPMTKPL